MTPTYLFPTPLCNAASAASRLKLPTFWLGGNSLNVARNCPTYCCAGTSRNMCSTRQRFVVHALVVGRLEGVGAQVEDLRQTQRHERLLPDVEAVRALLGEDDLPLVVAQRHQRAVVVEVEELVARAR